MQISKHKRNQGIDYLDYLNKALVITIIVGGTILAIFTLSPVPKPHQPEVLIECKTDMKGKDLTCHFTNLGVMVTQECIVVGMKCRIHGEWQVFHSPEICSGWLTPLTTDPHNAESWSSPGSTGTIFPPEFTQDCEPPYAIEHTTMTAAQFIEENQDHPPVRWKY